MHEDRQPSFGTGLRDEEPDMVNHPPHYTDGPIHSKCGQTIECIDIVRYMLFNPGNVIKYLWRAGKKGPVLQDVEKAQWYLNDEVERLRAEAKKM